MITFDLLSFTMGMVVGAFLVLVIYFLKEW